jgi:hypothetical protein
VKAPGRRDRPPSRAPQYAGEARRGLGELVGSRRVHDAGVRLNEAAGACGGRGRSVWVLNRTEAGADVWGAVVPGVRLLHGELERAKADGRRCDDRA